MFVLPAVAAGLGVLNAGASWWSGHQQASRMRAETDEQVRRLQAEQAGQLGQATAAAGASGVELGSGSLRDYLTSMSQEFQRQAAWLHSTGYAQARATSNAANWRLLGDLGGSLMQYGAANNWFRAMPGTDGVNSRADLAGSPKLFGGA